MILLKSESFKDKVDDIVYSALLSAIYKDCSKFLKQFNLYGNCLLSGCKGFKRTYLLGLTSYVIVLEDELLTVILIHKNYNKQFSFKVSSTPTYADVLIKRAKENFRRSRQGSSKYVKLINDFIQSFKKLQNQ